MALSATMYVFTVRIANADRDLYETVEVRLARHPSETPEFLLSRLLAYCLEYQEGISFSRGLSEPDEPAIAIRDLTGALRAWIDIGTPEAARIHKASKASPRVAVYVHRDSEAWLKRIANERIHRAEFVEAHAVDQALLEGLVERLERRMEIDLTVSEGVLYVSVSGTTLSGTLARLQIGASA